jgi:hypothetical protein
VARILEAGKSLRELALERYAERFVYSVLVDPARRFALVIR